MPSACSTETAFVVFHGEQPGGPLCDLVNGARRANALDLLERAGCCFKEKILLTHSDVLARETSGLADEIIRTGREFHFGSAIKNMLEKRRFEKMVYFGSGAGALLTADRILALAESSGSSEVLANNLYSMDFCVFGCDPNINRLKLPPRDNSFPRILIERGAYSGRELPRSAETIFDIDAPLDLAVLKYSGKAKGRLKSFVERFAPGAEHLKKAAGLFTVKSAEVMVAGRISADTHIFLDRRTACRVRLLSEERGLFSSGNESSARSVVGAWLGNGGPVKAFESLAGRTNAVFLDTRMLLAHEGLRVETEERFAADLFEINRIRNTYLKSLAAAARIAPFPVVLANHSLLNGGMMLLVDTAWRKCRGKEKGNNGLRGKADGL